MEVSIKHMKGESISMQKVYLCLIVDAKKSGIWSILEVEMTSNATI
jgi:hypothetical protein